MKRSPWALKSIINPNQDVFSFRVSASVFSVSFRVRPWQMLLLGFPLFLPSVANAYS
jgi:hypothetical protein